MEHPGADSREKSVASSNHDGNGADAETRQALLDAPNRYTSAIQGELVRLAQVNRSMSLLDAPPTGHRPAPHSARPATQPTLHPADEYQAVPGRGWSGGSLSAHTPYDHVYRPARNGGFSWDQGLAPQALRPQTGAARPAPWYYARPWSRTPSVAPPKPGRPAGHGYPGYAAPSYEQPARRPPQLLPGIPASSPSVAHAPGLDKGPARMPHARNVLLSDGELSQHSGDDAEMSEGEVRIPSRPASPSPALAHAAAAGQPSSRDANVEAIIRERMANVLKLRDPKLLQTPGFRALMLLLKCIKSDDPDAIYSHIKNAALPVASELSALAHEFKLQIISDACANAVLAADPSLPATRPNLASGVSVSSSEDMDTDVSSTDDQDSSPEVDMDTSSDAGYEGAPSQLETLQTALVASPEPMPTSKSYNSSASHFTPSPPPGFSRSRAPSPPSAHPRASRTLAPGSRRPSALASGSTRTGLLPDSPELGALPQVFGNPAAREQSLSPELTTDRTSARLRNSESTVCGHENGSLIVFVNDSDSGSESDVDTDVEDNPRLRLRHEWTRAHADRQPIATTSQPVSRTQSSASATGMDASMSATTASKPPSDVLLKAKNDLRAHEAEIARLKLQIKQRQTKALLLQKMQKAKQQQPPPETPVDMVSTPSTPDVAVDDGSDAEPAPAPPVAPPKAPAVANASDEPIATRARSTSKAKPAALQHIPTIDYAKQALGYISDEARERHLGKIAAHLDEALELKKMTLQLLTRNSPSSGSKAADAEQKSRAQASERLKARQHRLGAERAELQHRVHQLHIATMIAGAERRFLDYSCGAGYELQKAVSSSECARSSRELEAEIQALVKLKKSMTRSGYTVQPADKQADVDVDVSMVIDPRPTQTVAEPQASPIAELQELSVSGLEPAATESVAAEPVVAEPEAKLTAAKPAVAALRAKMAAMQEEQSTMSQRLTTLAEKRKQASSAAATTLTSKKAKTRDKPAKCHPDSLTTSLHLVLKTMKRALDDHTGPYVGWCMSMAESLDTCMLQPLTLIDRIGVPSMICPRLSSGTESPSMADEQLASSAIPAATLAVAQNLPSQGGYVPYESMLGSMDAATVTTDTKLAVAGPSSTNLDKLTTDQLLAAIQEAPSDGLAKTQSYYHELRNALSAYKKNLQGGSISNGDLARTLLPVWNSYKHTFPKKHILPKNPLYTELGLKNVHHSPSVDAFTRKEQSLVLWLVERDGKSLPILNRDILRFRPPANKRNNPSNRPTGRYFEAAVVSQDGDEDSEEGEVTLATQQLDRSDAAYQQALDHFWKGLPTFKQRPPTLNDLRSYIASRADKNMGKAVLTLQQALEKVPESEKLWDLYLELYTRQRVSEKDVVSAFSDATRFHPYSTCIWRRYVVWCGWHAMKQKKPSAENTWLERLRMVASMAIKCLASAQATARTERLSATIVELLVYFWQCLWTAYKADKRQANGSGQPALSLPAYMHACLAAESISVLSDKMANVDLSVASEEQQQGLKGDWDCSQWALFTLLLPHHFLYAAQAFAFAFIDADFVSQHVLDCMFAALHSRTDSESMYFIDLDKIRGDGSTELDPRMVTFVLKLYGALLVGLDKPDATDVPSYTDHLTECSRALFHASIGATLAQLRQPHVLESHLPKRDELFWRFYGTPVSAGEVRSLPGQMASQGVHKFLLITLAVCANEFPGSFEDAALATTALWQHALFIAKSVNMDTADLESATQPGDDEDGNHALVAWRIAKTRSLYYRIVGYSGTAAPKTYRQLADMIADTGDVDTFCRQIRDNAGVWTNVVLVELLYFEICARGQSNKQAVQSALAWLRCGLEHLDPENVGSRAQLWALLLRLLLTQRPLKDVDIVEMHQDLVHPPLADEFQNVVPCFMLMNFVLQPILQANPDNQTLTAIMEYLSVAARSNSELAVRIINYASLNGRSEVDLRTMARRMAQIDDPDLAK